MMLATRELDETPHPAASNATTANAATKATDLTLDAAASAAIADEEGLQAVLEGVLAGRQDVLEFRPVVVDTGCPEID